MSWPCLPCQQQQQIIHPLHIFLYIVNVFVTGAGAGVNVRMCWVLKLSTQPLRYFIRYVQQKQAAVLGTLCACETAKRVCIACLQWKTCLIFTWRSDASTLKHTGTGCLYLVLLHLRHMRIVEPCDVASKLGALSAERWGKWLEMLGLWIHLVDVMLPSVCVCIMILGELWPLYERHDAPTANAMPCIRSFIAETEYTMATTYLSWNGYFSELLDKIWLSHRIAKIIYHCKYYDKHTWKVISTCIYLTILELVNSQTLSLFFFRSSMCMIRMLRKRSKANLFRVTVETSPLTLLFYWKSQSQQSIHIWTDPRRFTRLCNAPCFHIIVLPSFAVILRHTETKPALRCETNQKHMRTQRTSGMPCRHTDTLLCRRLPRRRVCASERHHVPALSSCLYALLVDYSCYPFLNKHASHINERVKFVCRTQRASKC